MSLTVYDRLEDIPEGIQYVHNPILYFDRGDAYLDDSEEVKYLLKLIDKAIYFDEKTVRYPGKDINYDSNCLSGGLKTLLCVIHEPNVCFNVDVCGPNVLSQLIHSKKGLVHLSFPYISYRDKEREDCDVIWRGKHLTDVYDYLSYVMATLRADEED